LIDIKQLEGALRPDTSLVSIMTVNNEIGVRQPVHDIGKYIVAVYHSKMSENAWLHGVRKANTPILV
jgi:cysteine sulfinate desulfinase/cysteine desulfurase-like protein